jgi:hypothetical protein
MLCDEGRPSGSECRLVSSERGGACGEGRSIVRELRSVRRGLRNVRVTFAAAGGYLRSARDGLHSAGGDRRMVRRRRSSVTGDLRTTGHERGSVVVEWATQFAWRESVGQNLGWSAGDHRSIWFGRRTTVSDVRSTARTVRSVQR